MTSPSLSTRVYAAWECLYALLDTPDRFTRHPRTGEAPLVIFGDVDGVAMQLPNEAVIVVGVPDGDPAEGFYTFGAPSKSQTFRLQVIVRTTVEGSTRKETFGRLRDLTSSIERALRSAVNGNLAPPAGDPTSFYAPDPGPQCSWWGIAAHTPSLGPTPTGFGAVADLKIEFQAHI